MNRAGESVEYVAVIVTVPFRGGVVYVYVTRPKELVRGFNVEKTPPALLSLNVTVNPGIPLPYLSVTETIRVFGNLLLGCAV